MGVEQEVVDFGVLLWLAIEVKKLGSKKISKNVSISFYSSGKPPTFWFLKATVARSCITPPLFLFITGSSIMSRPPSVATIFAVTVPWPACSAS